MPTILHGFQEPAVDGYLLDDEPVFDLFVPGYFRVVHLLLGKIPVFTWEMLSYGMLAAPVNPSTSCGHINRGSSSQDKLTT